MKLYEIAYLEGEDVNDDGSLKVHVGNGLPVLVMVQGNFCGWCTKAKPEFQNLLGNKSFAVVTVQTDGDGGDKAANAKISKVNKSPGVPSFLLFDRNGRYVQSHDGDRTAKALASFAGGSK